jgi:hypothetical protein
MRRVTCASFVAQVFRRMLGVLEELLGRLHEQRGTHNQFGLMLDR